MIERWYYADGGQPIGPISLADVSARIKQAIGGQHLVWTEGMNDWQDPRDLPEFASIFVTPPPLPSHRPASLDRSNILQPDAPESKHHPWRRYFARTFDIFTFVFLGSFGLGLIFPSLFENSSGKQNDAVLNFIMLAAYIPVEAFCLYAFGTTLGKTLYRIRLSKEGNNVTIGDGFKRAFAVWLRGLGAGIPIVVLFTQISAYNTLKSKGAASWDSQYGWTLSNGVIKPIGWVGILSAWVVVGGLLLFLIALGSK